MNLTSVIVRDSGGEQKHAASALPLRLGTGSDCEIRLPGPGNNAVALLDELDGAPFVQPVGRSGAMRINGDELTTSRKLSAGDELEFFGSKVIVAEDGDELLLTVRLEDSAYVTRPPEVAATDGGAQSETIAPAAFRRAAETAAIEAKSDAHRWKIAVGVAIGVLVLVSS